MSQAPVRDLEEPDEFFCILIVNIINIFIFSLHASVVGV